MSEVAQVSRPEGQEHQCQPADRFGLIAAKSAKHGLERHPMRARGRPRRRKEVGRRGGECNRGSAPTLIATGLRSRCYRRQVRIAAWVQTRTMSLIALVRMAKELKLQQAA
jgi:hypothetical protein